MSTPDPSRRMRLTGVHHVTLVAGDLARTTEFYSGVLGLTLLREGANPDDPGARHFWFGEPGSTLVSFLEYGSLPEGSVGRGSTHHLAFSVASAEEQDAWREWLASRGVPCTQALARDGLRSVYFRDPDGHVLEIAVPV